MDQLGRDRVARIATDGNLSTAVKATDLTSAGTELDRSAADDALLEGILEGHESRIPTNVNRAWP